MADGANVQVDCKALLATLNVARRDYNKVAKSCMRDAAKAVSKDMRTKIPQRWRSLIKYRAKLYKGDVEASFGLSSKVKTARGGLPDWNKAYWLNYGTLSGRDHGHRFRRPINAKLQGRDGIKHQNFFESAIAGFENRFLEALQKAIDKKKEQIFNNDKVNR